MWLADVCTAWSGLSGPDNKGRGLPDKGRGLSDKGRGLVSFDGRRRQSDCDPPPSKSYVE